MRNGGGKREVFREGGRICSLFAFVLLAKACGARGNGLMGKRERERERPMLVYAFEWLYT